MSHTDAGRPRSEEPERLAASQISYEDLYARWERGNWSAMDIDFSEDRRQWRELPEFERTAALWNYALFFWGEDAVADNLSPYIDAAPREEQKYFITTQQVDEARHAIFFKRFMHEVCDVGDGSARSGLAAIKPGLTWGFMRIFDRLDTMADELRRDRSPEKLSAAVTLYHMMIEATLAQTGQHFVVRYLEERDMLPGFREGMQQIARDEQRHIGFGVKLLSEIAAPSESCRQAVADLLREVTPWGPALLVPPGWNRDYTEIFGFTLEDIGEESLNSLETKMRSAGMPLESLPGPGILPPGLSNRERAVRGYQLVQIGLLGEKLGPPRSDAEAVDLVMDMAARQLPDTSVELTIQLAFTDIDPWVLMLGGDAPRLERGRVRRPDIRLSCTWEDWIDIAAGRLHPRRALLTRRLRPRARPSALKLLPARLGRR